MNSIYTLLAIAGSALLELAGKVPHDRKYCLDPGCPGALYGHRDERAAARATALAEEAAVRRRILGQ